MTEAARQEVSTLNYQLQNIESEVAKKRAPLVAGLKKIWEGVNEDLTNLATIPSYLSVLLSYTAFSLTSIHKNNN